MINQVIVIKIIMEHEKNDQEFEIIVITIRNHDHHTGKGIVIKILIWTKTRGENSLG